MKSNSGSQSSITSEESGGSSDRLYDISTMEYPAEPVKSSAGGQSDRFTESTTRQSKKADVTSSLDTLSAVSLVDCRKNGNGQGCVSGKSASTASKSHRFTTRQSKNTDVTSSMDNFSPWSQVDSSKNGNQQGSAAGKSSDTGQIIGGSVAAVCLLTIGLFIVGFIIYRRKKFQKHSSGDSVYQSDASTGNVKIKPVSLDNPAYGTDHVIQNGHLSGVTELALPSRTDMAHTYDTIEPPPETAHPPTAQISADDIDLVDNDVYFNNGDHTTTGHVTSDQSHASGGIGEDTDMVDNEVYVGSDNDSKTNVIKDVYSQVNANGGSKDTLMVENDVYAGNDNDVITDDTRGTHNQSPNDGETTLMADNDVYSGNDNVSTG